jgi:hypothetical protein
MMTSIALPATMSERIPPRENVSSTVCVVRAAQVNASAFCHHRDAESPGTGRVLPWHEADGKRVVVAEQAHFACLIEPAQVAQVHLEADDP